MSYKIKLVLRRNKITGTHKAGFAGELPLQEYDHMKDYDEWPVVCGPFIDAWQKAQAEARTLNLGIG
jgi:hypothetical protein